MKNNLIDENQRVILRAKDNLLAWRDIIFRLSYLLFFAILSTYFFNSGLYLPAVLAAIPYFVGFSFLGLAGISHELFHNSVFKEKDVNQIFFKIFCILTWTNYSFFKATHWKHHKHTLTDEDPKTFFNSQLKMKDVILLFTIDVPAIISRLRILFLNALNIIPSGKHNDRIFLEGSIQRKQVVATARLILVIHFLIIFVLMVLKLFWLIALINFASFILTFPNKLLAIAQHYGTDSSKDDYFFNTRTVKLNPFFSFLYANMNYHVEHHIFPEIPYYNLHLVHNLLKDKHKFGFLSNGLTGLVKDLKAKGLFKQL